MSEKIKAIDNAIHAIVRDKNHIFLLNGQSCVEWFRYALITETLDSNGGELPENKQPNQFNFVPIMRQLRFIERKMNAEKNAQHEEKKLTNIITFGMGITSIFEQSIFEQFINHNEEKKLPIIDYYIGNNLMDEVKHENIGFVNIESANENEEKVIIVMNIDEDKCIDIGRENLDKWKQPNVYQINKLKIIECDSSHYLYLGYLYLLALAWKNGMCIPDICKNDLNIFYSVNHVIHYINENFKDYLIKPILNQENIEQSQ